jgi:hypothetical protein
MAHGFAQAMAIPAFQTGQIAFTDAPASIAIWLITAHNV